MIDLLAFFLAAFTDIKKKVIIDEGIYLLILDLILINILIKNYLPILFAFLFYLFSLIAVKRRMFAIGDISLFLAYILAHFSLTGMLSFIFALYFYIWFILILYVSPLFLLLAILLLMKPLIFFLSVTVAALIFLRHKKFVELPTNELVEGDFFIGKIIKNGKIIYDSKRDSFLSKEHLQELKGRKISLIVVDGYPMAPLFLIASVLDYAFQLPVSREFIIKLLFHSYAVRW